MAKGSDRSWAFSVFKKKEGSKTMFIKGYQSKGSWAEFHLIRKGVLKINHLIFDVVGSWNADAVELQIEALDVGENYDKAVNERNDFLTGIGNDLKPEDGAPFLYFAPEPDQDSNQVGDYEYGGQEISGAPILSVKNKKGSLVFGFDSELIVSSDLKLKISGIPADADVLGVFIECEAMEAR